MWSNSCNPTLSCLKVQHRARIKCSHTPEQHLPHPLWGRALTQHKNPPPSFRISQLISDKDMDFTWSPDWGCQVPLLFIHPSLGCHGQCDVLGSNREAHPHLPEAHLWKFPLFGGLLLKQETLTIPYSRYLPNKTGQLTKWLFLMYKYIYNIYFPFIYIIFYSSISAIFTYSQDS